MFAYLRRIATWTLRMASQIIVRKPSTTKVIPNTFEE